MPFVWDGVLCGNSMMDESKIEKVSALYMSGKSLKETARGARLSVTTARLYLAISGVPTRPRGTKILAQSCVPVIAAIRGGLTPAEAARKCGVSRSLADRVSFAVRLRDAGVL